jgi:hypothetical protein
MGLAGTVGVPTLASTRPVIGQTMTLSIGNSRGAATPAVLLAGPTKASLPIFGGTLLVTPLITIAINVASPTGSLPVGVPNSMGLVGSPFNFQVVEVDPGAPVGLSFTPGLEVRPSSR